MYALGNTKLFTATFKVISYGKIQMNLVYNSKEGISGEILNNQRRTINIKLNVKLENIELNENEITIEEGCQRKLIVKYKPEETTDNKTIIWSSSNENVATVNQDGTVCAVSEGKCIVTAECNGKKAECEVYVCKKKIELKSIDIGKDITLEKGETYQLKIKYNPENTTESKSAIYESSNSHIAIVDDTGKIVAQNEGIAYITVKVNNLGSMIKVTVYTRNDKEDSSTTKNDKEDNSTTKNDKEDSSTTKNDKEDSSTTKNDKEDSSTTKNDKEDSSTTKNDKEDSSTTKNDKEDNSNTKDDKENNSETKNDNEDKNNQTENNKTPKQSKNNDKSNDRNNNSSYKPNNTNNSSKNNMVSNKNNKNNSNVNNIKNDVSNLEENIERETNSILQNQEQNNNVENELAENQINNNTQEVSANIVETSKPNYTWIVVIIVMGIIIIIFLFVYLKLSRSKH